MKLVDIYPSVLARGIEEEEEKKERKTRQEKKERERERNRPGHRDEEKEAARKGNLTGRIVPMDTAKLAIDRRT